MSLISLQEAANRIGVSEKTIEEWAQQGLLEFHQYQQTPLVDVEKLEEVAESLGWLHLSMMGWDGPEQPT